LSDCTTNRMKRTWDTLAQRNAMHFIATERDDWDIDSFLESGKKTLRDLWDSVGAQLQETGGTVLDLGCGIGRLSFAFAEIFDHVIAVDVSEEMIKQAKALRQQYAYTNVEFRLNNGRNLDFIPSNSCDLGFSYIVLQHIPDKEIILGYIRELARVVKPNGRVLFQVPVYKTTPLVYPWCLVQASFRLALWRAEKLGCVPPEKTVAFRGTRLSTNRLENALRESNLKLLTNSRSPSTYRLCDDAIIYCQKN
jgi:SAM-dependent methyltransferase